MKFYEFDENEKRIDIFNERWYRHPVSGKFYRNVTTILNIISKGYNYDEWLKQTGYNSEIIVDRSGRFGTVFHEMAEKYLLGEEVSYYDYRYLGERTATNLWERFSLWIKFWEELTKNNEVEYKPEGVEHIVYNDEYKYAGTVDLVCKINGKPTIFDWKTGNHIGDKERLQLTAYMQPLGVETAVLVHIPAKKPNQKGYRLTVVDFSDERFDLFVATKKLFDANNKDIPKILTLPLSYKKDEEDENIS